VTWKTFLIAFSVGCGGDIAYYDSGEPLYPIEEWTCSHNESRYSAYVEASTIDLEEWTAIDFFIHDHDSSYSLPMKKHEDGYWRTSGNIYELDCNSDNLGTFWVYYEL
jgi:hypothetical protein|tara:strand:+ start:768 stop:1091 length:324 start_codon:yes stop_codon:yes gene_type:complete